jgi:hypothetical protein
MPLDHNITLKPNPEGTIGNRSNSFAQLLGALQFLVNTTRPNICYTVNRLAVYMANLSLQHAMAIKRILKYLSGTREIGISYKNTPEKPYSFYGYTNATFANMDNCKLIIGYVFLAKEGAIT